MFLLLPPNDLDLRMGFGTKSGIKTWAQVKGSALIPGSPGYASPGTSFQEKNDCP